ncbi:MAG TPA: ROK family protein, partial [Micromonosporaceae bacterium]|nr:ROK family protein [Micromonosporaceae bacterium]
AANIDRAWIGVNAVNLFGKATGRAVGVVNDADAAGIAEVRFGAGANRTGVIIVVTLGTGIGSGLFVDGKLVANTELGHLHLHHGDAEAYASDAARERDSLSWEEYAHRLQHYLELIQSLFWPDLIVIGGGISKKADKYLPHITIDTEVVPASLQNDAGIVGAAMFAPLS